MYRIDMAPSPMARTLVDLLIEAPSTESRPAVVTEHRVLSHEELRRAARRVRDRLQSEGVGRGDVVAVCGADAAEMAPLILGVLLTGAAYHPVDAYAPVKRIAGLVVDSRARLLVTDGSRRELLDALGIPVLVGIAEVGLEPSGGADIDTPRPHVLPQETAYVIHTSGSTGRSKGVQVSHGAICTYLTQMVKRLQIEPGSSFLLSQSLAFDFSLLMFFLPLLTDGTLHAVPGRLSGREFCQRLPEGGVDFAKFTPSHLRALLADVSPESLLPRRALILAGEGAPTSWAQRLAAAAPGAVLNSYGPTETVAACTMAEVSRTDAVTMPFYPLGDPLKGADVMVLDGALSSSRRGELYVGEPLATGYVNQPGLTATRFVAHPSRPGERVYRTGDLAQRTRAGQLEFLGREDDQVKIRGYRVEPAEIAAVLESRPEVRQAAVIASGEGDTCSLIGYVVPADGSHPWSALLADELPDHLVPRRWVELDELPLTANGKLDRGALPAPRVEATTAVLPPRDAREASVLDAFSAVLGTPMASVETDFFEAGGNSLSAARVVALLHQVLSDRVTLVDLYESRTAAALAARIPDATRVLALSHADRCEWPLTAEQRSLWFAEEVSPGSTTYVLRLETSVEGTVSHRALDAAVRDVVERHLTLRSLVVPGPAARQRLLAMDQLPSPLVRTGADATSEAMWRPIDLETEIPLRVGLTEPVDGVRSVRLAVHHIACDGASIRTLARDLGRAYAARLAGCPPVWPDNELSYGDFADWQHRTWSNPSFEPAGRQLDFWADRLAGCPASIDLPSAPGPHTVAGGHVRLDLDEATHAGLARLAHDADASVFQLLHAGMLGLLQRLGCGDDLMVGTVVSRRPDPRLDGCIGHFVKVVPLRTTLPRDPELLELVGLVTATDLTALGNADVGFDQIVAHVTPARSPRHPLVQVVVASEYGTNEVAGQSLFDLDLDGTVCRPVHVEAPRARFDLSLLASEQQTADGQPGGISLVLEHALAVVSPADAARWARALTAIFDALAADPRRRLSSVDLFDERQRALVLAGLNIDDAPAPRPETVPALFARAVDQFRDAIAIDEAERSWTYRELDEWSNGIAWQLIAEGVRAGDIVGNALPRSAANIATVLGISKCGAAWLPIDPQYPDDRIRAMLGALGSAPVVALGALRGAEDRTIHPTQVPSPERPTDRDRGRPLHLDDLAYVIFTSGSTGVPKGVAIPHRGLRAVIGAFARATGIRPGERQLHQASTSFDMAIVEILVALFHGGTCVVAKPGVAWAGAELSSEVAERRIDHLLASPTALRGMVESDLTDLQSITAGGEALPADLVAAHSGRRPLVNSYGPTEVTICCTIADELAPTGEIPIGGAVAGDWLRVLDGNLTAVLPSVAGELYVGTPHLARGYLGQAGLTASRFVADPWGNGTRMYRSGDVVRCDANGVLTFVGRSDSQVKVRGFRIELGEIESRIARRGDVATVYVLVRKDRNGDSQIVAYVVPAGGHVVDPRAVRDSLRTELPHYMVPATVQVVERLPMTPNGKIDPAALPAPEPLVESSDRPRNPVESVLASVFAEVLGCEAPGVRDDFFMLGGHSLLATRAAAEATAALGIEIGLKDLFESPTVAGLAELLGKRAGDDRPTPQPRAASHSVPLSPAQQRLWAQSLIDGPSSLYNVPLAIDFTDGLDARALADAIDDVVARHEALRSRIVLTDGEATVDFLPPDRSPHLLAIISPSPETVDEEVDRLISAPFDLAADRLVRANLVLTPSGAGTLVVNMHHIVCDGASMSTLLTDLATAYAARLAGAAPDWSPLPIQFGDAGQWAHAVLGKGPGSREASQLAWWMATLQSGPEECIPTPDRPRPAVPSREAGHVEVTIPADVREALSATGRRLGASLHMVVAAAVALTVARTGGGYDVPLGTVASGRTRPEFAGLVGFFVNTLVARIVIEPDWTFDDLIREVRRTELDAWAHQDVPFDCVVEALAPSRHLARHPIFQVMFALDTEESVPMPAFSGTTAAKRRIGRANAKFDLAVLLEDLGDAGIRGVVEYSTDLYERATAERFAASLARLLAQVPAGATVKLHDIELHDPAAALAVARGVGPRGALLEDGAAPDTLDSMFRRSAEAHADLVAVECGADRWTYRELDAAAEDLCRRLSAAGVRRGDIVGLVLPRGPLAVAGMLAISRSGGAWLPLDLNYPQDRLTAMVEDARPSILLTSSSTPWPGAETCVIADAPDTTGRSASHPPAASLDDAAYVIYTSGTTGRPKGVVVTHRGLRDMNQSWTARSGVSAGDRHLQNASLSFDAAIAETLQALLNGATLCVPETGSLAGVELGQFVDDAHITHAILPPSTADRLTGCPLTSLRCLSFGGETIDRRAIAELPRTVRVLNAYGPTEATVATTMSDRVSPDDTPIGHPLGRTPHLVLDEHLAPASVAVPGTLYVSGVGLARGYLNRPGATAQAFVAYPHGDGERMYRTGDLVAWREDGALDFHGRSDSQVKVRGFRIELGEVESVLREHPAVAAARVVVHGNSVGDRRLDAYVVLRSDLDPGVLRDLARDRLPAHAVPSTVTRLPELPLTTNGKLDVARLPEPEMASAPEGRVPRTAWEAKVLTVFADVLRQPALTIDDNFFEFGGHSLLAGRVVNRLRAELNAPAAVRDIFEYPTVADLCNRITAGDVPVSASRPQRPRPALTRRPD